jgi:MFS family permease
MRIMASRTMAYSCIFGFLTAAAFTIPLIFVPFYFQSVKSASAIESGVDMIPFVVGLTVSSIIASVFLSKVGYYTLFMIIGGTLLTVGSGLLGTFAVDTTVGQWIGFQIVVGFGSGVSMQAFKPSWYI